MATTTTFCASSGILRDSNCRWRTVLRAGMECSIDTIVQHHIEPNEQAEWLYSSSAGSASLLEAPVSSGACSITAFSVGTVVPSISYDENLRTPYAQHYNLTLQRDVRRSLLLSAGYVGSKGPKLTRMRDITRPFTYRDR